MAKNKEKTTLDFDNIEIDKNEDSEESGKDFINRMIVLLKCQTHYIVIKDWKEKPIFRYNEGIFIRDGDTHIKEQLRDYDKYIMPETMNTISKLLMTETYGNFEDLNKDINHIVVNNGTMNILTNEFSEHSPQYKSTVKIPIKYNKEAKCPLFLKFLNEILYPESIPVIFEMIGYCLYKTNVYKKIFYLYGKNDCGKSTLLDVISFFLGGDKVVSAETIQSLGNPFTQQRSAACLVGKLANLCGETPTTPVKETAMLKALSYGDPISVDEKYGNKFSFKNFSKLIISSNHMIQFPEEEEYEMMSRMKFIMFPYSIPLERQDKTLLYKLTTPEEMSGILNLSLEGLQRMIKNGEMSSYKTKEENLEIYNSFGNSVKKFVNERIEKCAIGYITNIDLEKGYEEFCIKNKLIKLSNKKFFEHFKLAIGFTEDNKIYPRVNGVSVRAINGLLWKIIEDKSSKSTERFCMKCGSTLVPENGNLCQICLDIINTPLLKKEEVHLNIQFCNICKGVLVGGICNKCSKNKSNHSNEIILPEVEEPEEYKTEGDIQLEKEAFEQLEKEMNVEGEIVDLDIEETAKMMFAQNYEETIETDETPELTEEAFKRQEVELERHCSKCDKNLSPDYKLKICKECLEIINKPRIKEVEKVEYCKKCGTGLINNICYQCKTKIIKASHSLFATEVNIDKSIQEE